jgi:protein-S-isoprenylcysteine O-methyltransferase Ste14
MPDLRDRLFTARSYTPIPFILAALVFSQPTAWSMLAGGLLALAGESMRFWGVAYAGSLTRVTGSVGAPEVIMSGPFARVRNPLYVGNIMLYTGVGVMSFALWPWLPMAALVWFVIQYSLIVSLEEEFLEKEFGEQYLEYRRSVPRFIPQIRPYVHPVQDRQRPDWEAGARSERRTFQAIALVFSVLVILWSVR